MLDDESDSHATVTVIMDIAASQPNSSLGLDHWQHLVPDANDNSLRSSLWPRAYDAGRSLDASGLGAFHSHLLCVGAVGHYSIDQVHVLSMFDAGSQRASKQRFLLSAYIFRGLSAVCFAIVKPLFTGSSSGMG